jgi:hypothetical protein
VTQCVGHDCVAKRSGGTITLAPDDPKPAPVCRADGQLTQRPRDLGPSHGRRQATVVSAHVVRAARVQVRGVHVFQ